MSDLRQRSPAAERVTAGPAARRMAAAAGAGARRAARSLGALLLAGGRAGVWLGSRAVGLALTLALLLGAGAGVLAWRLGQGPLDVTTPARWAAERFGAPVGFEAVTLAWSDAPGARGLRVRAQGVRAGNADVAEAEADLPLAALLAGEVQPRRVEVSGVRVRGEGGPGEGPGLQELLDSLRQPGGGPAHLRQLRTVRVRDAAATVQDPRLGPVQVSGDVDLQRTEAGGVAGTAALRVVAGGTEALLDMRAAADAGGTRVSATLSPIEAAALLRLLPKPPPVTPEGAITLAVDLELTDALLPRSAAVRAGMGAGRLLLPGATVAVNSLALEGTATWEEGTLPSRVEVQRAQAVVASPSGGWPSTLVASGTATRAGGRVAVEARAAVDHLLFADLGAVWPEAWGGNARPWIVRNLSDGTARDAHVEAALDLDETGKDPRLQRFAAALAGDDVTIHWLRPAPPIEHAQARLAMQSLDAIEIAIPSARQGTAALTNGAVRITGLTGHDEALSVTADVAGNVPDTLTLLRHPRLKLADKLPKVTNPAGSLAGKLTVALPLKRNLDFEEVSIGVTARLQGLRLGNLVARREFDRGDVQAEVSQDGLRATGTGTLGTVPGQFTAELDFRPGKPDQVVERVKASGRATPRQLAAAGLDPSEVFTGGSAAYEAEYVGRRNKSAEVSVQADLRAASLAVAGWKKAPGAPATASASVVLQDGDLQGVNNLRAQGPGLELRGRADMVGDVPALLVLDRIALGPTRGKGTVEIPTTKGDPVRVALEGTVLDLSDEVSNNRKGGGKDGSGTPLVADIRFDKVLVGEGRSLSGVSAHAEYDGRTMRVLRAQSSGPERIQAVIAPEGRTRRVSVRAADGGLLLRALDITDSIRGGALALEARYDDARPGAPLAGTLDISNFHVSDGAAIGKLLQAITVYGIPEALSGPGVAFSRLIMPFRYVNEVLELGETQAYSASLGLTARGRVDVGRRQADVNGTVVPAYVLNSALGRLPLVGRLFSAERGGGLLAVEYAVRGPLGDVSVSVNPLSAITPGALRRLFRVFD